MSAIPVIAHVVAVFAIGGLYTFCFIVLAPIFFGLVDGGTWEVIIAGIVTYGIPSSVMFVYIISLILTGQKQNPSWNYQDNRGYL